MGKKTNQTSGLLGMLLALMAMCPAARGEVIYVDDDAPGVNDGSSWVNAFNYLQDALITASAGDEIRVAEGTYRPNQGLLPLADRRGSPTPGELGRSATFVLKSGLALKGGFAGFGAAEPNSWNPGVYETILSGDLEDNDADVNNPYDYFYEPTRADNSVNVITSIADDASATLDGFVVTGAVNGGVLVIAGSPTILNCIFSRNSAGEGGAILVETGQPLLRNCKFISNLAGTGGALYGMDVDLTLNECSFIENWANGGAGGAVISGNAVLTGCVFSNNISRTGGGLTHSSREDEPGKLELIDCAFIGNSAVPSPNNRFCYGGAVWTTEAIARNCIFRGNWARRGGAVYGWVQSIENCIFTGNMAEQGGALYGMQDSTIRNSIFTGNRAEEGGVLYSIGQGPSLTGCTLSDNSAQNGNAIAWGMRGHRPTPLSMAISNCILWDGGDEIGKWGDVLPDISIVYSDIQGGWPGEGNINLDPCFARPGYWDPNGTADDPNDDFWIEGDYHLKSQAGRWDPLSESWVRDDVTSPCIDAGDPHSPVAFEPFPNGGRINMGAYGGTPEASKSPSGQHAKYGGGTGNPIDPYLIYTPEQMNAVGAEPSDWDKHFKLMADIDLSGFDGKDGRPAYNVIAPDTDIGKSGFQGTDFTGVFDGNGHRIWRLTIEGVNYLGLFGCLGPGAEVSNLRVLDVNVTGSDCYIGSIAGCSMADLTRCYTRGTVGGDSYVGGLTGWNQLGHVTNCFSTGAISGRYEVGGLVGLNSGIVTNCSSAGVVTDGYWQTGGLAGSNTRTVINSYSTASVSGTGRVGGVAGHNAGDVVNCYSTGAVSGSSEVGGLVGDNRVYTRGSESGSAYDGVVTQSFWDVETSGQTASAGGVGKTTAEMQMARTFLEAGWDFAGETANGIEDIWWILEGKDYPRLWWELTED